MFHASDLPDGWDCEPLKARLELAYGRALHEEDRHPGDVDVFGSNGKVGTHNVHWLEAPGILIGRKGSIGAVHYATRAFWPIDTAYYVKPIGNDYVRYLYYLLQYLRLDLLNAATGVPGLSRRDAYALCGAFPKPDEQTVVARVLDAVDTTLDRTNATVASAYQLRKSLIADLLSRGVGSDGNVRNPEHSPNQFARTRLGQLPTAWTLSQVGEEFKIQNGFTINEAQQKHLPKRRYLRVANVQRDALILDEIQELKAGDDEFAPRVLAVNDLLVVEGHADRMQIGRCARVTEESAGMTFQNHLFRLRTCGEVMPEFACLWLNSAYAQRYWNACCATSSGLNTINQRMLKRLVIPVVPKPEQEKIAEIVRQQRRHLEALVAKANVFESLKKSLMHDLLTGCVRLKNPNTVLQS